MFLVYDCSSLYFKIKQILAITFESGLYYSYWLNWLPYDTLQTSIHVSGREHIGLGDAVGSLIVQGGLQS